MIYCDKCNYSWQASQALDCVATCSVYRSKGRTKGKHVVQVWRCPADPLRYSFALLYGSGVAAFNEFVEDRYLSGSYDTPQEALAAGKKEIENE